MLTLLLGTAGTGKTTSVLKQIKARAKEGNHSILLVPEQFSAAMEGVLYRYLGDEYSMFVTSCSFRTLGEGILDTYGGGELPLMSDAGRAVLVRRAMDTLEPEDLGRFGGQKRSAAFCAACADVIQEMKTAGVSPDLMYAAGGTQPRLRQLSMIYHGYESLLHNTALDPADRLSIAAEKVQQDYFEGKEIFADGFDGFTAPQYKMLETMAASGANLTVGLCCHSLSGGEPLFLPTQQTAQRLSRMASRVGVQTKIQRLEKDLRHIHGQGMAQLTAALTDGLPLSQPPADVWLTCAESPWQQAKYAAAVVAQKAREGVPYHKMVVVCRNKDPYAAAFRWECNLLQIPLFEDEPTLLQFSPCAAFLQAAVGIVRRGINEENVLELLKTGLVANATVEQIALLENYIQVWHMKSRDWFRPLPKNRTLSGFEGKQDDPQEQYELAQAEAARSAVAEPLQQLIEDSAKARSSKGINGAELCRLLYRLLEQVQAPKQAQKLALQAKEQSETAQEDWQSMWDAAMQLLDELYRLLEQDEVTATEFGELLNLMLRSTELGKIPQMLEGVLFTTADRLQPQGIECCVVLGANEGEFPQTVGTSGLLTHSDRDLLKQAGATLPGEFEQRVHQEELYFYRTATAAAKQTWFFYQGGTPESRLSNLLSEIQGKAGFAPLEFAPEEMCQTPKAALDWVCGKGGEQLVQQLPELLCQVKELEQKSETPVFKVEDSYAMEQILGKDLTISPSRMERFYRCKLAYFLEHIVRLKLPRPAKLDAMLSGSLVHYILEKALQDKEFLQGEGQGEGNRQTMEQLAQRLAQEYLDQLPKEEQQQPLTRREQNTVKRIVKGMVPLLEFLQQEQQQSRFHPTAYELTVGEKEGEGIVVPLPNHHTAHLTGKIDRVDTMDTDQRCWLRVVDYKTGSKKFSLDNVYYGLDTQMLLYLFSLCSPKGTEFQEKNLPAGVLYFLVSPNKSTVNRQDAHTKREPQFELHGLITDEPEVYEGMDTQKSGKYVPFKFKKDGIPDSRSQSKRISRAQLMRICSHLRGKLQQMGTELYLGEIEADPLKSADFNPCDYCDYKDLCRRLPDAPIQEIETGSGKKHFLDTDTESEEEDDG